MVSLSVAELFPGVVSLRKLGTATLAVFDKVPVAVVETVPLTV